MSDKKVTLDVKKLYEMGVHKLDLYTDATGISFSNVETKGCNCNCNCGTGCNNKVTQDVKDVSNVVEEDKNKGFYDLFYNLGETKANVKVKGTGNNVKGKLDDNTRNDNSDVTCGGDLGNIGLMDFIYSLADKFKGEFVLDTATKKALESLIDLNKNNDVHSIISKLMQE